MADQPPEEEREYRERFFREAEAAGHLSHPGIVTIFDVGEEPETRAPCIVMEFVAGQSLDKALLSDDDHKLPLETALQLTLELAEALDCAHGQGVVHRDLKPANILITQDGHTKIADFVFTTVGIGAASVGPPRAFSNEWVSSKNAIPANRSRLYSTAKQTAKKADYDSDLRYPHSMARVAIKQWNPPKGVSPRPQNSHN